jgi:predicted acetyltransferase
MGKSFRDDFPRLLHESNIQNLRVIRDENENIISHVASIPFSWFDKEKNIELSCVIFGGVCTDLKHRGQGLASLLLQDLSNDWANSADLALLWTDKNELYEKQGFQPAGCQLLIDCEDLEKKGLLDGLSTGPPIRTELTPLDKIPIGHLKDIYNRQSSFIRRSDQDWKQIQKSSHRIAGIAYDSQSRPLAYLVFEKGHDFPQVIHEIIGDWNACLILIKKLRSKFEKVSFLLQPANHTFSEEILSRGVQIFTMDLALMKILNEKSFLSKISFYTRKDQKNRLAQTNHQAILNEIFGTKDDSNPQLPLWVWGLDSH